MEFWDLYQQYGNRIYSYFLRYLGNREDAADLTGNVFLKAQESFGELREQNRAEAWLWAITRNTAKNFLRDRKELVPLEEGILQGQPSPFSENGHRVVRLKTALRRLSGDDREILILREYHAFTYEELAALLETSTAAVRSRLFRARQNLKSTYFARE